MGWLGGLMLGLVVIGGLLARRRAREAAPRLDDELIRRIERDGRLEVEEPLDLQAAREAEEEFWEETAWDPVDDPDE